MKQESTATLSQLLLLLVYYAIRGDGSPCFFFWAFSEFGKNHVDVAVH